MAVLRFREPTMEQRIRHQLTLVQLGEGWWSIGLRSTVFSPNLEADEDELYYHAWTEAGSLETAMLSAEILVRTGANEIAARRP